MPRRLAYTLSFWLLGAVALSTLAVGGLTAWNLREGFTAYLQARDMERFDKLARLLGSSLAQGVDATARPRVRLDMPSLLAQLAELDGATPPPRPEFSERAGHPRPPPQGVGPPPDGGETFGSRVALARPDGRHWMGPRFAADEPGVVERPIEVDGQVVAIARLRPRQRAPEANETRFLRTQYIGIGVLTSTLLLLALGVALWLARQWVRPLALVQAATARIARGELDVRIGVERSDEIGDLVRNVNAMAESLQRIEGARRRWLADLSHELRTPLTVLRGDIEAMVDGVRPLSPEAVTALRDEVVSLGVLVNDLHLLAMADLNALPCHFAEADATQIVQHVLQRHARQLEDAGLTLSARAPLETEIPVRWDAARIEQLLGNLLQNSMRYTSAPGRIEVAWRAEAQTLHLSLDDSAPGVPPNDLARLFEPLYRTDAARNRHHGGSGLGLAICEAIVRAHGGRITARDSTLGGLRIEIELPLAAKADPT